MDHATPTRTLAPGPLDEFSVVVQLQAVQEFDRFQGFKAAVYDWAVNRNHPLQSDWSRNLFCSNKSADCMFKVRAIWKANKEKACCTATLEHISGA